MRKTVCEREIARVFVCVRETVLERKRTPKVSLDDFRRQGCAHGRRGTVELRGRGLEEI